MSTDNEARLKRMGRGDLTFECGVVVASLLILREQRNELDRPLNYSMELIIELLNRLYPDAPKDEGGTK